MRASLLLLTACSATPTSKPVENRAAPPPKPACTESQLATINTHIQARWNTGELSVVRCTPGWFPTPGYFVEAATETTRWAGVLASDGFTELVHFAASPRPPSTTSLVHCATGDLDGDGIDEIIQTWQRTGTLGSDTWLEIVHVGGGAVARSQGPHTSVDHPDLGSCAGDVRIAGRTIVITVENGTGLPPSDCLLPGTHAFGFDRTKAKLVEITRSAAR